MPPRYAYWTILIDSKPTAFRATKREELMPTVVQLRRTNPNVVMKWFARGKLWENPEQAQWAGSNLDGPKEKRGGGWRPGGAHQDPRARFDRKKQDQRRAAPRPPSGDRPWNRKPAADPRAAGKAPRPDPVNRNFSPPSPPSQPSGGRRPKPGFKKSFGGRPPGPGFNKPFSPRSSENPPAARPPGRPPQHRPFAAPPQGRPFGGGAHGKPGGRPQGQTYGGRPQTKPYGARPPGKSFGNRPPGTSGADRNRPRTPGARPPQGGDRPWSAKPPPAGGARPWSAKPPRPERPGRAPFKRDARRPPAQFDNRSPEAPSTDKKRGGHDEES